MKLFEVEYYADNKNGSKTLMVERYRAEVEMQVRAHLNHTYHKQVKLESIKVIEEADD